MNKTVKVTLTVLGILAIVAIIIRFSYMKIQEHNKNFKLENRLENSKSELDIAYMMADRCKCFPAGEMSEWKQKFKSLDNLNSVDDFEWNVKVFSDSVFAKRARTH